MHVSFSVVFTIEHPPRSTRGPLLPSLPSLPAMSARKSGNGKEAPGVRRKLECVTCNRIGEHSKELIWISPRYLLLWSLFYCWAAAAGTAVGAGTRQGRNKQRLRRRRSSKPAATVTGRAALS